MLFLCAISYQGKDENDYDRANTALSLAVKICPFGETILVSCNFRVYVPKTM